jgi:hypothetical protein
MNMDNDFKQQMIDLFTDGDVPYGVPFDDGRRWCGICQHPRLSCAPGEAKTWKEKACMECSGVWPEYGSEFVYEMQTDEDFMDNFPDMVVN